MTGSGGPTSSGGTTRSDRTLAAEARALLNDDLASLSDAQLVAHLQRAFEFVRSAIFYHHRFNFCSMVPLGDFLVHAIAWTGLPAGELLRTMKGLSPDSAGAPAELAALRCALQADGEAMAILTSTRPSATPTSWPPSRHTREPVGDAMRAYMAVVGLRVLGGYDIADRHGREHPELIVKIIRSAVTSDPSSRQAAAADALQSIRARVPEAHREQFDELLGEAQLTYRMRDERGFHTDTLAVGVARRAVLAAGERLKARGLVHDPSHLVDATTSEIVALLEGRQGPTADELGAARALATRDAAERGARSGWGIRHRTRRRRVVAPGCRAAAADHDPRDEPDVRRARGAAGGDRRA